MFAGAMSTGETACTYASLILFDDGIPVTAEKIGALLKAANLSVESYSPNLFAKLTEKKSIDDLIINVASAGAAAPVAVAAPSAGSAVAAPPPEEKKEEPKEDTDEDLGFSLFD